MKHILGARTLYRRSDWYDGMRFNPAKNNCLSWRDEDQHLKLRTKMAAGVSPLLGVKGQTMTFIVVLWARD